MCKLALYENVLKQMAARGDPLAIATIEAGTEMPVPNFQAAVTNNRDALGSLHRALVCNAGEWTRATDNRVNDAITSINKSINELIGV